MMISAPGYQPDTLHNVLVTNGMATVNNASLLPLPPVVDFSFSKSDACGSSVQFKDLTGSASTWHWYFGDSVHDSIQNPIHIYQQPGNFVVQLTATNCAGTGFFSRSITVSSNPPPFTSGDTSHCGAKVHHLQALSGNTVEWYSAPSGSSLLGTGTSYTSIPLPQSTTFYAQSVLNGAPQNVGPQSNTIGGGGYFTANTYHYLLFDAHSSFVLKSVQVYAAISGVRNIQLRNSGGVVLQTIAVNIPSGGSRIILNFSVPAGFGYQLGTNGGNFCNLYRNQGGAVYPYEIENVVSITGNSASNSVYYYYFYDWEIVSQCRSPRIPVKALVLNAPLVSTQISASNSSFCEGDTALFQATGLNAGAAPIYTWLVNGSPAFEGLSFKTSSLQNGQKVSCRLLSADSCAVNNPDTSNVITMSILPRPDIPVVSLQGGFLVSSSTTGNQWFLDGNPIVGATNDSLPVTESGTYTLQVTGTNGCRSNISGPFVINSVAAYSSRTEWSVIATPSGLDVYNPSSKTEQISVFNSLGQIILNQEVRPGKGSLKWNVPSSGMYVVSLSGNGKTIRLMAGK